MGQLVAATVVDWLILVAIFGILMLVAWLWIAAAANREGPNSAKRRFLRDLLDSVLDRRP